MKRPGPTPQGILLQLINGQTIARCIWAAAELGLADCLARGSRDAADVARELSLDADALDRLMRALVSVGVFKEENGGYVNDVLGEVLRTDVPNSMRDAVRLSSAVPVYEAWGRVLDVLRTGRPAIEDLWATAKTEPAFGATFHRAMTVMSTNTSGALVEAADLTGVRSLVDVGGGEGTVIAGLLNKAPAASGVLFDQPAALTGAPALLAAHNVADRCRLVGGDFFVDIPAGHDLYILKHVLHNWNDADAARILATARRALRRDSTLWIVDAVLPDDARPHARRFMDMQMLVVVGGRERSATAWRRLLESSGFALAEVKPLQSPAALIVARPAP